MVGIIDIGTNSVRLMIARVKGNRVEVVHSKLSSTRLGQGIGCRRLNLNAVERTLEAIVAMQRICIEESVEVLVAVATSAVRDADNKDWFLEKVYDRTGIKIRVLTGEDEAYYSFLGVSAGFELDFEDVLIIDIGGGSTEFTWKRDGKMINRSVNAGAVRMTEGNHDDQAIKNILIEVLREVSVKKPKKIIGVGGTVTTLAAMDMAMEIYDRERVHGYTLKTLRINDLLQQVAKMDQKGSRKPVLGLQPARADIIAAGIKILLVILKNLEYEAIQVSEADLMYGLAIEAVS
ncbi:MAG: Ppx/GppA family phosphatase [Peptococcaceae bacterium]|nr:Ppx/GppA family phosphatase [Peptococcaceae bacterium]